MKQINKSIPLFGLRGVIRSKIKCKPILCKKFNRNQNSVKLFFYYLRGTCLKKDNFFTFPFRWEIMDMTKECTEGRFSKWIGLKIN